jgi:hypothetical protein
MSSITAATTTTDGHACTIYQFILYLLCLAFGGELL